ncbi:MAG: RNA polymerase sigma factor [bacterium]|nr:RNA polymerase sigma factor [bacterium]
MDRGDQEAFLKAYDELADALYRHCFFRVYSKARAQELMQEAFMKAWKYATSAGKPIQNLRAFLYKIANNLIIDESRKHKEESLEVLMEQSDANEPSHDGRADLEKDMLIADIKLVMIELDADTQQILTYRFIDDLEPKEIADILEITPNNASVRLNRALQTLKTYLHGKTD